MSDNFLKVLKRDSLKEGGFAGLKEHRIIMSRRLWGGHANPGTWDAIGNFIYLADARFQPFGETKMHPHMELDVISVMVEGRISHEGSLEHGASMGPFEAQVQRAGGEGFEHNEVNPDKTWNRMLQLWVLPETPGERASYKKFKTKKGQTTRIYGGEPGLTASFPAKTSIDVALLNVGQTIELDGSYYGYLSKGEAEIDGHILEDGDLFKSAKVTLKATKESQLIIIKSN